LIGAPPTPDVSLISELIYAIFVLERYKNGLKIYNKKTTYKQFMFFLTPMFLRFPWGCKIQKKPWLRLATPLLTNLGGYLIDRLIGA
jgi:hypothetical protein